MSSFVEVYGFVGWMTSLVGYVLYLLWALTPNSVLENFGVSYYPDKYWALAIPMLLTLTILYIFVAYEFINMMMVQSPKDLSTVQDATPLWSEEKATEGPKWKEKQCPIPPLKDIPIPIISRRLYSRT